MRLLKGPEGPAVQNACVTIQAAGLLGLLGSVGAGANGSSAYIPTPAPCYRSHDHHLRIMLTALYALLAFSSVVIADVAVTSPTNGSSISSGQQVQFNWYSDDENEGRQFDIALMSLRQVSYSSTLCEIAQADTPARRVPSHQQANQRDDHYSQRYALRVLL